MLRISLAAVLMSSLLSQDGATPPETIDLSGSFTFRAVVELDRAPSDLPLIVGTKPWTDGAIEDYTTNNEFGIGRASGTQRGFAISVLPDGAWTWNVGDGRGRLDHRPEAADQSVADGVAHEIGFSIDREAGVASLYHDGRRVAIHDLRGLGAIGGEAEALIVGAGASNTSFAPRVVSPAEFAAAYEHAALPRWNGESIRVLAWNIWHGGRRKGRDEGVARVVDVIRESRADIVLMQETYGSGPRIAGRLGFDYYLRSSNLSVMSRFPIEEVHRLYQGFRFGGATIELEPGREIEAYSLWIHYLPSVGDALERGDSPAELVAADMETRGSEIEGILDELALRLENGSGRPFIVGGDFNSGSHLDWTPAAKDVANHHGRVVRWPVSAAMERAGFIDTFRTRHPDPIAKPGHTWSPEFPESHQDRIDYVYASRGDWRVVRSKVLREHPDGWPSDHAAVLSELAPIEPKPALKVMSYNIHYGVGMDGEFDLARIAEVIEREAPDLVGLQEIGDEAMAKELSRLTGMPYVFGDSKGSADAYGDAVLSKYPFEYVGNVHLPSASSSRYQAMALDVDVSSLYGEGAKVRFVNTHYDWTGSIGSQEARRASADVIERALCGEAPAHMLLAGDLNAVPGSDPLGDLADRGWYLPAGGQPMPTHEAPSPSKQIDYVLVRPRRGWRVTSVRAVEEPVASDHVPVVLQARPIW